MAACIYCGKPADSGEHWLPRTFGTFRHLEQLRDRLCQRCNKVLGDELDQEIANTGTTGLAKFALGIEGRHKAPSKNPFQYKVMGTEAATTMLMDSPDGSCKILGQFFRTESGEARATALRQLVFTKSDGTVVPVQFPRGYSSERLRELVKVRGVDGATLTAIYIDPDESHEDGALLSLIKEALGSFNATVYGGIGESAGRKDILVSSNISLAYMRGIAKLAFHYYLAMSDQHTGAEFLFQPIRTFIREGKGDYENFVILLAPHFIKALASGESPDVFCHFLAFYKFDCYLTAVVQLFVGPEHVTFPSLVLLGITKRPVTHRVHQVTYYGQKVDGYDGELSEVPDVKLMRLEL